MLKLQKTRPLPLLMVSLSSLLLMSCETKPQTSPKSYSVIITETASDVKAAACIALKPDMLTEAEEANVGLLNYAAREAASWKAFGCELQNPPAA
jgi:hypothetical protein